MRLLLTHAALAVASAPVLAQGRAPDPEVLRGCGTCHGEERTAFERDVHAAAGLDCTSCHGGRGGTLEKEAAHAELRPLADPRAAVESCGGCHADQDRMRIAGLRTDQLSLYWRSAHGGRLAESGDPNVATCSSCHASHGVLRVSDPRSPAHPFRQPATCGSCHADAERMAPYELPATVVEDYLGSVHGFALIERGHLAAPSCADCHGAHGAQPPGVAEIEQVCGQCHSVVQEYYERSAHFSGANTDGAAIVVQCASCHENHAVEPPSAEMFLGGEPGHCGGCHEDDAGAAAASRLHEQVEDFAAAIAATRAEIGQAAGRGLFMESRRGYVDEAEALLVRARAMTHAADPGLLVDALSRGDAMLHRTDEELALEQRGSRDIRIFTGLFFLVALAFAIVLLMYARMIRGEWKERGRGGEEPSP